MGSKIVKKYGYKFVVDGQEKEVDESRFNDYGGIESYKEDFPDASVRMTSASGKQANIPLSKYDDAVKAGFALSKWEKNDTINEPSENDFAEYFIDDSLTEEQKNINNADTTGAPAMTIDQIEQAVGEADGGADTTATTEVYPNIPVHAPNREAYKRNLEAWKAKNSMSADDMWASAEDEELKERLNRFDGGDSGNSTNSAATHTPLRVEDKDANLQSVRDIVDRNKAVNDIYSDVNKKMLEYGQRDMLGKDRAVQSGVEFNPETKQFQPKYVDSTGGETFNKEEAKATSRAAEEMVRDVEGYAQKNTQQLISDDVKKAFADEQTKANERAIEAMSKTVNGGFVPAYSGLHQGVERSAAVAKELDIEPMIENVTSRILADENAVMGAIKPYLEAGFTEDMAIAKAQEDLANGVQREILSEYKKQNAPQSTLDYVVSNAFRNSLAVQLAKGLAQVRSGASGLNEQIADEAYGEAGEKAGSAARVVSGVGSLLLDAPVFGGLGMGSGAVVNQATNAASRAIAKNVIGASGKAGVNAATRYVGGNLGTRMIQGALSTGGTLGSYDALGEALRGMRTNTFDAKEVFNRGMHGFGTGMAIGWITPASRYLSKDMSTTGKVMTDVGAFVTEAELFNIAGLIEQGKALDLSAHAEGFAESAATLALMKGSHLLGDVVSGNAGNIRAKLIERYKSPDYITKARFTREELADLKRMGYNLGDIFTSKKEVVKTKANDTEGSTIELGGEYTEAERLNTGTEFKIGEEFLENYAKMQADARVPMQVKAKMAYFVEGKVAINTPLATRVDYATDNEGIAVETYDALGRLVNRKRFKTNEKKQAEALVKELQLSCEANSVTMMERVFDRYQSENTVQQVVDDLWVAEQESSNSQWKTKAEFEQALMQSRAGKTAEERRMWETVENIAKRTATTADDVRSVVEKKNGVKIADILAKPENKRTLNEVAALAEYERELSWWLREGIEQGGKYLENGGYSGEPASLTEGQKATETAPLVEEATKVVEATGVAERGGKAVDVEDVIAVYNFSKSDAVAARKQPDVYERFIDDLEFDRQMAIAWSKGDPASRKPDNWEYWKEREGLSEPATSLDTRTEEQKVLETEEQKNTIAPEEQKANESAPVDVQEYVAKWNENTGEKVQVANSVEEVANTEARTAIEQGVKVKGWYDTRTGEVVVYAPNVKSAEDLVLTVVHENVSHKGLRDTLGEDIYNKMCDKTWEMMDEATRAKYEPYAGVNSIKDETERHRAAADEYIASIAEKVEKEQKLTESERSIWSEVLKAIKEFIVKLYGDVKLTEQDIASIIRVSYDRMRARGDIEANSANSGAEAKVTETAPVVEAPKAEKKVRKPRAKSRPVDAKKEISRRLEEEWNDAPSDVKSTIESIANTDEVIDVEDVVYATLAELRSPKTRHKLILQGDGVIKGVTEELGLPAKELQKALGVNAFATRANGGISLQKMAENIVADLDRNITGASNIDVADVRDMLIEAIQSAGEPADISYHRARRRIAMAEKLYNDWKSNEDALEETYASEIEAEHAAEELWLIAQQNAYELMELNHLDNIFADELAERERVINEQNRKNDEQTNKRGSGSDRLLHSEQVDTSRRMEDGTGKRGIQEEVGDAVSRIQDAEAQAGQVGGTTQRKVEAEVAKASKAKTAKKKAGEDIAKVEEAMKAEKAKRELKTKEDIETRLAEIREEYEADKEGRDIQTQAEAMVELYGGYANAPKDVKAKIDAQVAKLSARRQELAAEERELEKKLATLAKKQTPTTLDTRTEGQKADGGYSENSANSGAVEPYLKTDAELTEGEQKGIEYEIERLANGFGLKPSQLRGVEVKHNADNTAIMVATEWSEGASTARVVELIADNGTNAPDRIWQAYVDGKPASKLMVDEDVNAKDMEDLFDERGLLREPTIEDFLKRRGIEFSMVDRDKAIGEARFSVEEDDENLVGLHNLTEANLAHAAKMGGLANPSMAVVNRDIATLDNFGDITLVASKALVDKKSGKNAGTWGADAYSPRYPRVEYRLSEKASKELRERGESAGLDSYDISSLEQEIESNGKRYLVGDRKIQKLYDAEGKNGESISEYVDRLYDSLDITERLFKGYTWDGRRRYAKHTLENVSRMMKAEGRAGAEGNFGMGSVRAKLTPIFKNIAQIKKSKDRIVSHEDFEKAKESLETRFYELTNLVSESKFDFAAADRLGEAMLSRNPKEYLEQEYGIEISDEESQEIKTLAADLSVMPTEYFETKFERPVMLEEFAKAVIPNDATAKTRQILADAGLEVVEYDPNAKGDRLRAVREASERGGVRFSVIGEKGAKALDKSEGVTTRLSNLAEAKDMEAVGEDTKSIKKATGWERGADDKWRYEKDDIQIKSLDKLKNEGSAFLHEVVDDKELFTAYPHFKNVVVGTNVSDGYLGEQIGNNININKSILDNVELTRSVLVHEIQHRIQQEEGFSGGRPIPNYSYLLERKRINRIAQSILKDDVTIEEIRKALKSESDRDRKDVLMDILITLSDGGDITTLQKEYSDEYAEAQYAQAEEDYKNALGEIEARNVQERIGMTAEERRNSLVHESKSTQNQIFGVNDWDVSGMGSREDRKMAEVGKYFEDRPLTTEQRAVVDVYSGVRNNVTIKVKTATGERSVVMRQGIAPKAGTKHSLYRHYNTGVGVINAEDILLIPEIIANGERTKKKRGETIRYEYEYATNGVVYTVVTEINNRGYEIFDDFYTNKSSNSHSLNTKLIAQEDRITTFGDKDSDNSLEIQKEDEYSGEGGVRFAVVEDEELIKRLDADEKVIGYRNVVLNEDGTFESPMANSLRSTDRKAKEKTGGFELNKWERSEERPHLVDENGKITLVKPNGKAVEKVDYNPYIHNRLNRVNKQFKQAWERPNLVYIKTEIPLSDLESGYHAEKAKLPVGEHKWNGGNLILSRYDKPVEICDWNDVADDWQASFKKKGINFDIIPPALLPILEERGMKIIRPHKNMGDACNKAYADWAEARGIDTKGFWAEVAKETEEAERAKAEKKAKKEVKKKAEGGVRFRFIGEQGAKSMDKKEGTTARMDNLAVAKKMLDEYSYKEVKMATGWEKGMDGKWRYETPDFEKFDVNGNLKFVQRHPDYARYRELVKKNHKAMLLNQDPLTEAEQAELDKLKAKWGGAFGKMDNVTTLDAYVQDDDLFNAYPELKSIRVKLTDELPKGTRGRFVRREADDILILDPEEIQGTIYLNSRYPLREVESTLIHEIQHVIQHIEGFAKGGNSEMINEEEQRKYGDAIEFTKDRIESHRQLIHEYREQQGEISDKMNDWYNRHGDEAEFDAEMRALGEKWDAIDKKIDGIRKRIKEDEQWLEDHNKKDFRLGYEGYRALAGEVEARNVQKRRGMTPEERRNSLAEETEDVKRGQQIVIGAKDSGYSESLAEEQKEIAEKAIKNVVVDKETAPKTRQEAIARLSAMKQPFLNKDQNVEIYVSNRDARHIMQFRNSDQIAVVGSLPVIIERAVKIGELPVAQDEQKTTKTVSVYYCPIKVEEKQYSGRMIVKEYYEGTQSVDELHLYNVMLKKSAPVAQNASPESLLIYPTSADVYKVKDLIHNTQEHDKVLLGLEGNTRFSVDEYAPVWNEGESFAEANDRIRRKKTVLDIQLKQMERKRALGKSYDADKLEQLRAELEEVKAQIRYLEVGAPKPELAEGESETDASYVAKMNAWHDAMAEWNSKKYGEDAMLDNLLREASGAKADEDVTDEEFKQGLKDEEEKANLSVKEMKGLVKEQIRERRRGIEVSNWQDEMTIYDIKKRTTEEQRKLIPHILEGTYNDPQHRKDKRYADYLAQTGKTDVSSAEWSERKELLNDPSNVENTAITKNQHGLKESDIVEYAVDSDAEILVTGDNLNALIRFPNGDIYTLRKYGVQYLLHIHPEAKQNTMTAEDAELLGMFLRGEAEQYVPQGLREYVEKKEYDEGNTLEVVNEIREWYAEAWSQLEAEGMVYKKEAIEDYVTHIWDLKKSSPTAVTTMQKFLAATAPKALKDINNYVATNTPYVKERAIGSIRDGEAFGLVPKYEDITDIMRDYGHRMNEARENRRLVNFVKGLRVNGMEAIREEGGRSGGLYIPIKNEALRGYEVHRDVKPVLDVIFGEYHTTDNLFLQKLGHVYDAWGGLLKKINLSLSFFHHGALTETAIAMTNPFYAGKTIFKNILWDAAFKGDVIKWAKTMGDNSETPAYNDVELTKDAVSHFVQLGATSDYATKEVQAITAKFAEWAEGKVGAEELATVLDYWNKGLDRFLWDYLHDGLKIYGYKKLSTEIRAKAEKEGWDEEVLNRALDEAGQLINDTYGGQHWDLLGVSPNALKWARRAFLSPDWTLSTLRQALAPFGFGQMYDDEKFWKKWFKNDPVASVRKRYGRAFWVTAALFFGGIMNGLNAYYRMKDEDEEKKKAEEIRKTRPEYKSPYELAYPDGMRWWDYTMLGNTQGHETHLFGGRYKDGKEQYVRWGKQFRELPELFFGRDGLSFPQPMIDKITGKLNPMINLMSNLSSGYSLNGFQNDFMRDTRGWDREWARLQVLVAAHLPYSIPTDGEKEFKMIDLVMPSTKGFSNWKGIDRFKTAILAGDMDFCDKVYDACVKNGLHADELLDVAIKQIEVDAKRAMVEGVEDLSDAVAQHDKETNPVRKQLLANYIKKQMSAQDYEEITKEEMREKAYLAINGGVSDKNIKLYDKLCNSNDVIEDWRITKGKAGLKKYVDDLKALKEETDDTELIAKYVADNAKYLNQYKQLDKVQGVITSLKKRLGEGKDAEVMAQIREVRKKAFTAKGQEYGKKKKAKAKKEKPAKPIADYGKELSWSESEE